jgi:hypothetical protein
MTVALVGANDPIRFHSHANTVSNRRRSNSGRTFHIAAMSSFASSGKEDERMDCSARVNPPQVTVNPSEWSDREGVAGHTS